jgi:hypothetical protein
MRRISRRDTLDKTWIENLRKVWKKWLAEVRGRDPSEAEIILRQWWKWLLHLSKDMAFSKGFFLFLREDKKEHTETYKIQLKVMGHLKSLAIQLNTGAEVARFWDNVMTPGTTDYKMGGQHRRALIELQAPKMGLLVPKSLEEADLLAQENPRLVEAALRSQLRAVLEETSTKADQEFSRQLLALLSKLVTKYGPLGFGTAEREINLGKVRVVMEDLPNVFPQAPEKHRHPSQIQNYIPHLQEAEALLRQKGLGFLWYGTFLIQCSTCGGKNPHGEKFVVDAHYNIQKDHLVIFAHPQKGLARLIAHELGHRYYYKFMTQSDRARFDSMFGEVSAVTDYGSKATEEDFAEVFAHYIDGSDLSSEQLRRFKAFLGRTKTSCVQIQKIARRWLIQDQAFAASPARTRTI